MQGSYGTACPHKERVVEYAFSGRSFHWNLPQADRPTVYAMIFNSLWRAIAVGLHKAAFPRQQHHILRLSLAP